MTPGTRRFVMPGRILRATLGVCRHTLVVANFTGRQRSGELPPTTKGAAVQFRPAWKAETLEPTSAGARLTIAAKRGAMVRMGPRP